MSHTKLNGAPDMRTLARIIEGPEFFIKVRITLSHKSKLFDLSMSLYSTHLVAYQSISIIFH